MKCQKSILIIEVLGGVVTSITTNQKKENVDIYVVDWDNIKLGDNIPNTPWLIDHPETNVIDILKEYQKQYES